MTVQEQHIDFKRKLNKLDTATYANIEVPFIDEYLNEAMEIFIKNKLYGTTKGQIGFEVTQKSIEDLRGIVLKTPMDLAPIVAVQEDDKIYSIDLPDNYLYFLRAKVEATRLECTKELSCINSQHDDLNNILNSAFYSPSFEWEETPIVFSQNKIYIYTDGSFDIDTLKLDYIKRPARIANPDAFLDPLGGSGYLTPVKDSFGNFIPAVQQDCELQSLFACREIVDIAVELAHMDLSDPRFQTSQYKNKIYNN